MPNQVSENYIQVWYKAGVCNSRQGIQCRWFSNFVPYYTPGQPHIWYQKPKTGQNSQVNNAPYKSIKAIGTTVCQMIFWVIGFCITMRHTCIHCSWCVGDMFGLGCLTLPTDFAQLGWAIALPLIALCSMGMLYSGRLFTILGLKVLLEIFISCCQRLVQQSENSFNLIEFQY